MDSSVTNSAAGRPEKAPTVVISIDAMGGDRGPAAVVAGIAESAEKNPDIHFIVHGPRAEIEQLIARRSGLAARCDIRDAAGVVTMDDKPSQVLRKGEGSATIPAAFYSFTHLPEPDARATAPMSVDVEDWARWRQGP